LTGSIKRATLKQHNKRRRMLWQRVPIGCQPAGRTC
jgi:hypothetical protein